jgi:hypothetical protein
MQNRDGPPMRERLCREEALSVVHSLNLRSALGIFFLYRDTSLLSRRLLQGQAECRGVSMGVAMRHAM